MNVVALLSCVLCGVGTHTCWDDALEMGPPAAVLVGIIFAFSPPRFFRLSQLHLPTIQWVPFGLASLHAYFDAGRKSDLRLALAFFTLQALTSGHGAVFLLLAMAALAVYRVASGEPLAFGTRLADIGVPGALLLLPTLLILIPYRQVQVEMGLSRSPDDWISNWSSFLASPSHIHAFVLFARAECANQRDRPGVLLPWISSADSCRRCVRVGGCLRLSGDRRAADEPIGNSPKMLLDLAVLASLAWPCMRDGGRSCPLGWPGRSRVLGARRAAPWLMTGLFVLLRLAVARRRPSDGPGRAQLWRAAVSTWWTTRRSDPRIFYGWLTVVSLWLSAGPLAGLWPRVYWLPGLSFIRVPSRFSLLALLGVAVLAGMGFERLSATVSSKARAVLATFAGALLIVEFAALPLQTVPFRVQIPEVDKWLAGQPKPFVVAELPLANPANLGGWERRHTEYMLHSMAHWQKTVEGYSGLRPARHEQLYSSWCTFRTRPVSAACRRSASTMSCSTPTIIRLTNGRESTRASTCSRHG